MDPLKNCSLCKFTKSILDFNKKKSSKDGYQNVCRDCNSAYGKVNYKENSSKVKLRSKKRNNRVKSEYRKIILEIFKTGCIDCGEKDPVVLEFDHLKDKKKSISLLISSVCSLESLQKELAKCVVRCGNCHKRKTAKDFKWWKFSE